MRSIRSRAVGLLVVMLAALPVVSYGATIRSIDIVAADGISNQNLTQGSGVKTGHIQDGAVTDAKIGGTISGSKITGGTINTTQIANSAVTDAKISGTISGSKLGAHGHNASDISGTINVSNLPVGSTAGTVAAGEHNHDSIYQKKYGKVAVVAQSGGDYTDPVSAMNDSATWCGAASASNPCLLKIMPGVYNLGSNLMPMVSNIDIEGSGTNTTKIIGTLDGYAVGGFELRMIAVESDSLGINMQYASDIKFKNVSITVIGSEPKGINSFSAQGDLHIIDSVIKVSGNLLGATGLAGGGYPFGRGNVYITNSKFDIAAPQNGKTAIETGAYGYAFVNGSELLTGVDGGSYGISAGFLSSVRIVNSRIEGGIINAGSVKCFGVYNSDYNPVTCP